MMTIQKVNNKRQVQIEGEECTVEGLAYAEFYSSSLNEVLILEAFYDKRRVKPYVAARHSAQNGIANYDHETRYGFRMKVEALAQYNEWYEANKETSRMTEIYDSGVNSPVN